MKEACWGGCPKHRFAMTPDGEPGLHYLCAGYKKFFRHIRKYLRAMATLLENDLPVSAVMKAIDGPLDHHAARARCIAMRAAFLALAAAAWIAPAALACGYHDAVELNLAALNLAYPDALHVQRPSGWRRSTALPPREGRPAGAADGAPQALRAPAAYRDTAGQLGLFREAADARRGEGALPAFTVVLVGPMLWTRFEPAARGSPWPFT